LKLCKAVLRYIFFKLSQRLRHCCY
jgi:hypothetical protein